ncbi:hypothetical protein FOZ62_011028, partial [Perkinsus olseni]
ATSSIYEAGKFRVGGKTAISEALSQAELALAQARELGVTDLPEEPLVRDCVTAFAHAKKSSRRDIITLGYDSITTIVLHLDDITVELRFSITDIVEARKLASALCNLLLLGMPDKLPFLTCHSHFQSEALL